MQNLLNKSGTNSAAPATTELPWPELYQRTGLGYRLYFAGEAVAYDRAQCVDGAVMTGQLAAACVQAAQAAAQAAETLKRKCRTYNKLPKRAENTLPLIGADVVVEFKNSCYVGQVRKQGCCAMLCG